MATSDLTSNPSKTRNLSHVDGYLVMERCRRERGGFLLESDVEAIAADPRTRLTLLLVRCGGGRFLVSADQCLHFVRIIEEHAKLISGSEAQGEYIRDISLPSNVEVR